ncbi:MAG TPA: putative LPS assembly protein LptD [Ferruginibacter sp.]|nr:putative LPS assembly protein LptD [Ferruginibacter sp.]
MNQLNKGKAKYSSAWVCVLLLSTITLYCVAAGSGPMHFHSFLTADTIPVKPLNKTDSGKTGNVPPPEEPSAIRKRTDTNIVVTKDTFAFRSSKDSLDAPVTYHADDSMIMDIPAKKITLYGKETRVSYIDNKLVSPRIEFDQRTNLVSAYLVKDSNGNVISYPKFNQADFKTMSDSIKFNMKTGKGITKGTYTQQDEMFVYGERIKKTDANTFYAYRGRFTTCNLDTPHFAFVSKRIKFINKKMAITGPVHPEFEDVPVPVVLPFGIYPLSQGRHSGILAPSFNANEQLGLALEGLGYYKVINDKWDVTVRGTLYSYGGWTANLSPRYYKRYKYQGNLGLDIQHLRDLDKSGSRSFNIRWSHSSDTKARPGVSFNASVNAGSSGFNSSVPNSPQRNFQNILSSSITYTKIWKNKPFNLNVSANHNQNTNTKQFNINLPDIGFNVNTLYPFRRNEVIGSYKWYENIGLALNTNVRSLSSFYDTAGGFLSSFSKNYQWGASHVVPLTLSLPQLGNFQFSPSVSYTEKWYQEKFLLSWDAANKKLDTSIKKGFYTAREMNFGLGVSTRIFGLFTFGKKSPVKAIRHELRPQFSVSYKPDMNRRFWYSTQVDTFGTIRRNSVYQRGVFGAFGEGKFGGISFGIDNNLQMKVRNRKDTSADAMKKVTLIDGFSITSSYNFLQDSFQLAPFNINMRTNLFDKISISANAIVVPYLTNDRGEFIDKLVWNRKISLGKMTSGSIALQSQFKGGDKSEKLPNTNPVLNQVNPYTGMPLDEYQQEAAYIRNNPGEFANFNIPWSISLSYALNYSRIPNGLGTGYKGYVTQNVTWSGTLNLTPKWQIGVNGSYNITDKQLGMISMYLTREMHCWQMSINLSPVGKSRFFTITINPKSGLLRDLRINRTRYFYDL